MFYLVFTRWWNGYYELGTSLLSPAEQSLVWIWSLSWVLWRFLQRSCYEFWMLHASHHLCVLSWFPGLICMFLLQHTSHGDGRQEVSSRTGRSGARCRNSIASCADEQPHIGNYRLLKTIGKGNFAKVKLARHILTGREVKWYGCKQLWIAVGVKVLLG